MAGWRILRSWPDSFDTLVTKSLETRREFHDRRIELGAIARFCRPTAKSPLSKLVQERVAVAVQSSRQPFKRLPASLALKIERENAINLWDAVKEFGMGPELLRRAAKNGDCLIGQVSGQGGIYLFDMQRLSEAVVRFRSGVTVFDFATVVGVPAYVIQSMVSFGLLQELTDCNTLAFSKRPLLDPATVEYFFGNLQDLPHAKASSGLLRLSDALQGELSPLVWAEAFNAIVSKKLVAYLSAEGGNWCDRILVGASALRAAVMGARAEPLPHLAIPAWIAARIIGVNDVVLGCAVKAALVDRNGVGLDLPSVAAFRETYIFPSEIFRWFEGAGKAFANAMASAGFAPAAKLHTINLWRRTDVAKVFGESVVAEFASD